MEKEQGMTDYQFRALLRMIAKVLDGCKDLDDAKEQIADLLTKEK